VTDHEFTELARLLGRVEAKVDKIDEKQDNHAVVLAEYGVRLSTVERSLTEDRTERAGHRVQIRAAIVTGLCGLMTGGVGSILSLIHH
jgi:hypothetical protein